MNRNIMSINLTFFHTYISFSTLNTVYFILYSCIVWFGITGHINLVYYTLLQGEVGVTLVGVGDK